MFLLDRPTNATIQIPDAFARIPLATASPSALVPARIPIISPEYAGLPAPPTEEEPSFADVVRKLVQAYEFLRARAVFILVFMMIGVAGGMTSLFVSPPGVSAVAEVKLLPHMTLATPTRRRAVAEHGPGLADLREGRRVRPDPARVRSQRAHEVRRARSVRGAHPLGRREAEGRRGGGPRFPGHLQGLGVGASGAASAAESRCCRTTCKAEVGKSLREMSAKVDFLRDQLKSVENDLAKHRQRALRLPGGERRSAARRTPCRRTAAASTWRPGAPSCLRQVRQLQAELTAEQEQLRTNRPEAQRKFQRSETYRTVADRDQPEAQRGLLARASGKLIPRFNSSSRSKKRLEALASDELQTSTPTLSRESDPNYQQGQSRIEKLQAQLSATRASLSDTETEPGPRPERGEGSSEDRAPG